MNYAAALRDARLCNWSTASLRCSLQEKWSTGRCRISLRMKYCTECGARLAESLKFCTECGRSLQPSASGPSFQVIPGDGVPELVVPGDKRDVYDTCLRILMRDFSVELSRITQSSSLGQLGLVQSERTEFVEKLATVLRRSTPHDQLTTSGTTLEQIMVWFDSGTIIPQAESTATSRATSSGDEPRRTEQTVQSTSPWPWIVGIAVVAVIVFLRFNSKDEPIQAGNQSIPALVSDSKANPIKPKPRITKLTASAPQQVAGGWVCNVEWTIKDASRARLVSPSFNEELQRSAGTKSIPLGAEAQTVTVVAGNASGDTETLSVKCPARPETRLPEYNSPPTRPLNTTSPPAQNTERLQCANILTANLPSDWSVDDKTTSSELNIRCSYTERKGVLLKFETYRDKPVRSTDQEPTEFLSNTISQLEQDKLKESGLNYKGFSITKGTFCGRQAVTWTYREQSQITKGLVRIAKTAVFADAQETLPLFVTFVEPEDSYPAYSSLYSQIQKTILWTQ